VPEPIDYNEIIDRLTQKTEEGKVNWEQVYSLNKFSCTVDGEFTFSIEKFQRFGQEDTIVRLSMTDKENNEIFQVEHDVEYPVGRRLGDLHEVARRRALNVEDKINAVKNILNRI
jgi:hypothetical protein